MTTRTANWTRFHSHVRTFVSSRALRALDLHFCMIKCCSVRTSDPADPKNNRLKSEILPEYGGAFPSRCSPCLVQMAATKLTTTTVAMRPCGCTKARRERLCTTRMESCQIVESTTNPESKYIPQLIKEMAANDELFFLATDVNDCVTKPRLDTRSMTTPCAQRTL